MTKQQFVEKLAEKYNMSKKDAKDNVEAFLSILTEVITEDLEKDEALTFIGFGSFKIKLAAERKSFNPHTGKKQTTPAKLRVAFSPSKVIREAMANKKI